MKKYFSVCPTGKFPKWTDRLKKWPSFLSWNISNGSPHAIYIFLAFPCQSQFLTMLVIMQCARHSVWRHGTCSSHTEFSNQTNWNFFLNGKQPEWHHGGDDKPIKTEYFSCCVTENIVLICGELCTVRQALKRNITTELFVFQTLKHFEVTFSSTPLSPLNSVGHLWQTNKQTSMDLLMGLFLASCFVYGASSLSHTLMKLPGKPSTPSTITSKK